MVGLEPTELCVLNAATLPICPHPQCVMAEVVRFELTDLLQSPPFQDGAIDHSAILPYQNQLNEFPRFQRTANGRVLRCSVEFLQSKLRSTRSQLTFRHNHYSTGFDMERVTGFEPALTIRLQFGRLALYHLSYTRIVKLGAEGRDRTSAGGLG